VTPMSQDPWIRITGRRLDNPGRLTYSVERRGRDIAAMLAAEVERYTRNRYRQPLRPWLVAASRTRASTASSSSAAGSASRQ
jgi:hypothetical protein